MRGKLLGAIAGLVMASALPAQAVTLHSGGSATYDFDFTGHNPAPPYGFAVHTFFGLSGVDAGDAATFRFFDGLGGTGANVRIDVDDPLDAFIVPLGGQDGVFSLGLENALLDGVFSVVVTADHGSFSIDSALAAPLNGPGFFSSSRSASLWPSMTCRNRAASRCWAADSRSSPCVAARAPRMLREFLSVCRCHYMRLYSGDVSQPLRAQARAVCVAATQPALYSAYERPDAVEETPRTEWRPSSGASPVPPWTSPGASDYAHCHRMTQRTGALQNRADTPSGFSQLLGYRLHDWRDGEAVITLTIGPRHLNRSGALHGGVITTLIDAVGGYSGCFCGEPGHVRRCVTVSLSTQFLAQTKSGLLTAKARVRGGGKRLFVASAEVIDSNGVLLAVGEGVYRYRSGSENPHGVPVGRNIEKRDTTLG